ncbi:Multiple epidermal growth factor-like domains protein 6 [Merluccius polli]|uniref:Multiple epidermal growth factor-like domains protein 6 n=1 Tax=Merluccius polli TaxID=89951 RepID=A0AA47NPU1_MERPO|nr:Multiple epidermal growth factor-like domains protein 6 [Merluccius polli]
MGCPHPFLISAVHLKVIALFFFVCLAACPDGFYGDGCNQSCGCHNEGSCHPASGQCVCTAGWTGPNCTEGQCADRPDIQAMDSCESSLQNPLPIPIITFIYLFFFFFLPECPSGFYGADCRQRCLCQNHATCDKTDGRCACAEGWMGAACELECAAGRFGVDCQQRCVCENGGRCDRHSGLCSCAPGWVGDGCERACDAGQFGAGCGQRCRCEHGAPCDHVTGDCLCPPGWRGKLDIKHCNSTSDERAPQIKGKVAEKDLSSELKPAFLILFFNTVTKHGSLLSLSTQYVQSISFFPGPPVFPACLPGMFGKDCARRCGCSHGTSCHHISGECGCPPGFTGNGCEQACLPGTYGLNCNQVCQCSETNQLCHPVSGLCYCAPGFHGPRCDKSRPYNEQKIHYFEVIPINTKPRADTDPTATASANVKTAGSATRRRARVTAQPGSSERTAISVSGFDSTSLKVRVKQILRFVSKHITHIRKSLLKTCENTVDPWRYGRDCTLVALCVAGAHSNPASGRCVCSAGRRGEDCSHGCFPGWFGADCALRCNCSNGGLCEPESGNCTCGLGWTGKHCDTGNTSSLYPFIIPLHTHPPSLSLYIRPYVDAGHLCLPHLHQCPQTRYGGQPQPFLNVSPPLTSECLLVAEPLVLTISPQPESTILSFSSPSSPVTFLCVIIILKGPYFTTSCECDSPLQAISRVSRDYPLVTSQVGVSTQMYDG